MITKLLGQGQCNKDLNETYHLPVGYIYHQYPNLNESYQVIAAAGTCRKLRVTLSAASGAGSYTVTLLINGAPSALAVTVANPNVTNENVADDVAVSAGDLLSIKVARAASPTVSPNVRWMFEFEGINADVSVVMAGSGNDNCYGDAIWYSPYGKALRRSDTVDSRMAIPCPGTVKNLYVHFNTAPGAGTSRTIGLTKNGVTPASVVVTMSDAETDDSNTDDRLSVSIGDHIEMYSTESGAPANSYGSWGFVFQPAIRGQYLVAYCAPGGDVSNADPTYNAASVAQSYGNTSETTVQSAGHSDLQIVKLYAMLEEAPGAGKNYTINLRENEDDASVSFQTIISGTATKASAAGVFTPADYGRLDTVCTPSDGPAAARLYVTLLCGTAAALEQTSMFFMMALLRMLRRRRH